MEMGMNNQSDDEDDPNGQSLHSQFVNGSKKRHSAKSMVFQTRFKQQNHRVKVKYDRSKYKPVTD
jgi:hypothetical protein